MPPLPMPESPLLDAARAYREKFGRSIPTALFRSGAVDLLGAIRKVEAAIEEGKPLAGVTGIPKQVSL